MARLSALLVSLFVVFGTSSAVLADSLWNHNGSLMRLEASGDQRLFYYFQPRSVLQSAGVGSGTLLFDGYRDGRDYYGRSRVFSKHCRGTPHAYQVTGSVVTETKVVLTGRRQVFSKCRPTGNYTTDRLVFTYVGQL